MNPLLPRSFWYRADFAATAIYIFALAEAQGFLFKVTAAPALLYFLGRIAMHYRLVLRELLGHPLVWLMPVIALVSVLWSASPATTLRAAIQLAILAAIAFYIARRLALPHVVAAVFIGLSWIVLEHLPAALAAMPDPGIGIYVYKNFLVSRFDPFILIAIAYAVLSRGPLWLRGAAAVAALMGLIEIWAAQATTSLVTVLGAICVIFAARVVRMRAEGATIVFGAGIAAAAVLGAYLINEMLVSPVTLFFEAVGKDSTLTGRTQLWAFAQSYIAERPWLGFGYSAFWDTEGAFYINRVSFAREGRHLYFHSYYYEMAVQLGVPLTLLGYGLFFSVLGMSIYALFKRPDPVTAFFAAYMLYLTPQSLVENHFYIPFGLQQTLIWIAATAIVSYAHNGWAAMARLEPPPAPLQKGRQ